MTIRRAALATLIIVSSGLAFVPMARVPVYCATKAALHSYTLSLRHQLRDTAVEVIEVIPPAVHSNLGGSHAFGVPTDEYADSVMAQLAEGRSEVSHQFSAEASQASRSTIGRHLRAAQREAILNGEAILNSEAVPGGANPSEDRRQ